MCKIILDYMCKNELKYNFIKLVNLQILIYIIQIKLNYCD
jgi:hypothetical protein